MSTKTEDFKVELRELLQKYNASIDVDFAACSDLHGVQGEGMILSVHGEPEHEIIIDGWGIIASDLK